MRIYSFIVCLLITIFNNISLLAQDGHEHHHNQSNVISLDSTITKNIEISILTCGTGDELYSLFGHSAIRVKNTLTGQDDVYNYGTFSFNDPKFLQNFVMGNTQYWLDKAPYQYFIQEYERSNRSVIAQVLNINDQEAKQIIGFLDNNIKEENKYYTYNFVHDNCATRIRDAFQITYGQHFDYGGVLRGQKGTYRQVINQYMIQQHWARFGTNIILGAHVDSMMNDYQSMFMPNFLKEGFNDARFNGKDLVKEELNLFTPQEVDASSSFNGPFWMTFAILILTLASFHIKQLSVLKNIISFSILLITGILGVVILFLWLVSNHDAMNENWNILWALPTNIFMAFIFKSGKVWFKIYSLGAISILIVALIVHVFKIQTLPLMELIPLFGTLLYIYMDMYNSAINTIIKQTKNKTPQA